ncbi:hypothetical protein RHMOL_Rhmol06G0275000 [Rhododendron molle]|uniref:Uncharacterized protein n=1 Tax=Rhododendron molle TaxID=49168 RepID=A0ACC0NHQ7_RHOML|nr:hypothetical protein RHMOL_Rhmol06G0275000 [Rhododendron molle]
MVIYGLSHAARLVNSYMVLIVVSEIIKYLLPSILFKILNSQSFYVTASTRVSNELGAGNPDRAKHAVVVTLMLSLVLTLIVVSALAIWAGFFSVSSTIIKDYASLCHFVVISIILESITGVLSGVARGCGWQNFAVFFNLGTLYCIGTPISIILGFKHKLYARVVGFLLLMLRSKWTRMEFTEGVSPKSHCSSIRTTNPLSDLE